MDILLTSYIEAPDNRRFAELLYPNLQQVLRKLPLVESAKATAHNAMRVLHSLIR